MPAAKTAPALPDEISVAQSAKDADVRAKEQQTIVEYNKAVLGHKTLAEALVAAQADMPPVLPDKVNPHFKSKFVSLDHLIALTRPVLNRHGIVISQWPVAAMRSDGGDPVHALRTVITHVSGETMEGTIPLIVGKNDMQGLGGAITYARRYAWAAALGICADEDDDGNQASRPAVQEGTGASRSASQPKPDAAPVPASASDVEAYKGEVLGAKFDWETAYSALEREPGGVTAAAVAKHRAELAEHLAAATEGAKA